MFGRAKFATIKNINLVNSYVKGSSCVGGICEYGSITNCYYLLCLPAGGGGIEKTLIEMTSKTFSQLRAIGIFHTLGISQTLGAGIMI